MLTETERAALIERLRSNRPIPTLPHEAATEIEALAARVRELEEAMDAIRYEASRENGSWVHLKRCIAAALCSKRTNA